MVGHGAQIGCVRSSTARLPTSIAGLLTRSSSARRRSPTSGGILCCRPSWGRVSRPVTRCGRRIASTKRRSRARCRRGSGRTRSLPPVNLLADATHLLPDVVALRREIHRHPELGLELPRTQALVLDALDGLGMSIRTGTALSSVVADLHGEDDGPTVVLRGDMDALPMPEDTGVEFASSVDGVMHACGHDAHAAMLVGAARLLVEWRASLRGTVRFMFQPGEEGFAGARSMIDEGVLDQVDSAFALHVSPNLPSGSVWTKGGALMASANAFSLRVTGRGGHASTPYLANDPMPVAAEIVQALQAFVTRRINTFDPVVITITQINAGTTNNVIPEKVQMVGTLRGVSEVGRKQATDAMQKLIE